MRPTPFSEASSRTLSVIKKQINNFQKSHSATHRLKTKPNGLLRRLKIILLKAGDGTMLNGMAGPTAIILGSLKKLLKRMWA
jgi:hypothetical protein